MMHFVDLDNAVVSRLERSGGAALIHRAASRLAASGPAALAALEGAHTRGDVASVREESRRLAQAGRKSGARWVAELGTDLERLAEAGDRDAIARLIFCAGPMVDAACRALRERAGFLPEGRAEGRQEAGAA